MPSFRTTVDVVLDGEKLRIKTRADDQLNAERQLGRNPIETPVELGMRVWWTAFKRGYPEHPCSKTFGRFVEALEEADELEQPSPDEADPMDPTLEAGSDS